MCIFRPLYGYAVRSFTLFKVLRKYKTNNFLIVQLMVPNAMALEVSTRGALHARFPSTCCYYISRFCEERGSPLSNGRVGHSLNWTVRRRHQAEVTSSTSAAAAMCVSGVCVFLDEGVAEFRLRASSKTYLSTLLARQALHGQATYFAYGNGQH